MRIAIGCCALLGLVVAAGCDSSPPTTTSAPPTPPVTVPPPPPAPPAPNPPLVNPTGDGVTTVPPGTTTQTTPAAEATQQPAGGGDTTPMPDPNTETVKAEAGIGIKGRSLDEYEGVIVTPAKTYFRAKERIFFEIEFPKNLQIYSAINAPPRDWAEVKANVIDAYNLQLPQLPPGHRYDFDAEKQELVVVRPKK